MNATQSPNTATPPQGRFPVTPYHVPSSPEEVMREQERINMLLEINSDILEHVNTMQGEGRGGLYGQPSGGPQASSEFTICMKTIQCNVAWIAIAVQGGAGNNANARTSYGPLIMESPVRVPPLMKKYETLKSLFPGWTGPPQAPPRQQSSGTPPQHHNTYQAAQQPTPPLSYQSRPASTTQPLVQHQSQSM